MGKGSSDAPALHCGTLPRHPAGSSPAQVCQNPKSPGFNHFLFESVAALVRFCCQTDANMAATFEQMLFPAFQVVLQQDVQVRGAAAGGRERLPPIQSGHGTHLVRFAGVRALRVPGPVAPARAAAGSRSGRLPAALPAAPLSHPLGATRQHPGTGPPLPGAYGSSSSSSDGPEPLKGAVLCPCIAPRPRPTSPLLMPAHPRSRMQLQAYLKRCPTDVVSGGHVLPTLGVFQKLLASKAQDHEGFFLLEALVEHLAPSAFEPHLVTVWTLLFQRLQSSRTPKYTRSFVLFFCRFVLKMGPKYTLVGGTRRTATSPLPLAGAIGCGWRCFGCSSSSSTRVPLGVGCLTDLGLRRPSFLPAGLGQQAAAGAVQHDPLGCGQPERHRGAWGRGWQGRFCCSHKGKEQLGWSPLASDRPRQSVGRSFYKKKTASLSRFAPSCPRHWRTRLLGAGP